MSHSPAIDLPRLPPRVFAYGFSLRKRAMLRRFLGGVEVSFVATRHRIPAGAAVLVWGGAPLPAGIPPDASIFRVEDGFMRSVGLGADLVQPLSWVIDGRGIYFDSTQPSDLEHLLQTTAFPQELVNEARALRERIVGEGLTKYNVGATLWRRPANSSRVLLVPGQVETDDAIRLAAPGIRTNMGLLRAVREANASAYVVYKPHPDVVAGLRRQGRGEHEARWWCDEVVTEAAMGAMLSVVDEIHTITSLAGFEALLRGRSVTCYGQPFYSGWGLTTDLHAITRRTRRLALDELAAGALILYAIYVSGETGQLTTPQIALDELLEWRASEGRGSSRPKRLIRGTLRALLSASSKR